MKTKIIPISLNILLFAFLFISISGSAYSQKKTGFTPAMNSLNCLEFNSHGTGISVGNSGEILMSPDFGETWSEIYAGSVNDLHKTSMANDYTFVVAGSKGTILLSTDAGQSWGNAVFNTINKHAVTRNLLGVSVSDGGIGFAVGEEGAFFRTTDFGATWDEQTIGKHINLNAVSVFDNQNAIVVGDKNTVLFTTNGGESWNVPGSSLNIQVNYKFVRVTSRFTAYATTTAGHILKTTDLGNTWTILYADPLTQPLYRINLLGSGKLVSDGEAGTVLTSDDNGISWTRQSTGTSSGLYCLSFVDNMKGFAGGESGLMLRTDDAGKTWTPVDYSANARIVSRLISVIPDAGFTVNQNFPNPFNPSTNSSFTLPVESNVTLRVFDILGKQISAVSYGVLAAGNHTAHIDGTMLASGMYFYSISAISQYDGKKFSETKRMILVK
jgi:photosystem II stability/assembly factor-like uncharacterized protein